MASIPVENNRNPPSQGAMQAACSLVQSPAIVTPLASAFPPIDTNPFFTDHHRHHHLLLHRSHGVVPGKSMDEKNEGEIDSEDKKAPDSGGGREHKKRSKNWTRAETLKLIKLRSEMQDKFSKAGKKGELWEQIASGLQRDHFTRDAQQCRDKWEKLLAAYKEVKDGHKDKEDYPFYEELHLLLSGGSTRKEKDHHHPVVSSALDHGAGGEMMRMQDDDEDDGNEDDKDAAGHGTWTKGVCKEDREPLWAPNRCSAMSMEGEETEMMRSSLKRKQRSCPPTEQLEPIHSIRTLLETVMSCQQKIFEGFLESFQRWKERRDRMREEREERWRAEERAQSLVFNNAMLLLLQKLIEDKAGPIDRSSNSPNSMDHHHHHHHQHRQQQQEEELQEQQLQQQQLLVAKRSKNWKRSEVLELIRLCAAAEVEGFLISRAAKGSAAWDELSDALAALGIKRNGKQCREKWEKLMSGYREVMAGRREPSESPYFQELTRAIGSKNP